MAIDGTRYLPALSHVAAILLRLLYCCYWWVFFGTHPKSTPKDVRQAMLITSSLASAATAPDSITASISKQLAERRQERATNRPAKLHPCVALLIGAGAAALIIWMTTIALYNSHAVKESDRISLTFMKLIILLLATTTVKKRYPGLAWSTQRNGLDYSSHHRLQHRDGLVRHARYYWC